MLIFDNFFHRHLGALNTPYPTERKPSLEYNLAIFAALKIYEVSFCLLTVKISETVKIMLPTGIENPRP